jgi:demethylmenaquinone methyltransferase/2-methoxy-6-polyprenyl-1,4-benzoquinol methylase
VEKFRAAGQAGRVVAIEGDAMHLPAADASVNLVVSAFGFRNLANYADALKEIHRALKPGGEIGILEINRPRGVLGRMYLVYFERLLPWIGRMVSGSGVAYEYLPQSVARFPQPGRMLELMRAAGFADATWEPYTLGAVGLFRGRKA